MEAFYLKGSKSEIIVKESIVIISDYFFEILLVMKHKRCSAECLSGSFPLTKVQIYTVKPH